MKLSEKGKRKILDNRYWFMNEFEPDDFQGCVVMTVEEAKVIEELALLCLFLRPKAVTIEKAKVMKELNNRIEQAEKGNETK